VIAVLLEILAAMSIAIFAAFSILCIACAFL